MRSNHSKTLPTALVAICITLVLIAAIGAWLYNEDKKLKQQEKQQQQKVLIEKQRSEQAADAERAKAAVEAEKLREEKNENQRRQLNCSLNDFQDC